MAINWPLELAANGVLLRPLKRSDGHTWNEVRIRNHNWLKAWESTNPDGIEKSPTFKDVLGQSKRSAKLGSTFMFAIEVDNHLVGQITLGNVVFGSLRSAYIGYWIDEMYANRGIMTTAVALLTQYSLTEGNLHRIEISIRPENAPSIRVVEKLGFENQELRPRYLHIDGDWRDHLIFVMTSENLNSSKIPDLIR